MCVTCNTKIQTQDIQFPHSPNYIVPWETYWGKLSLIPVYLLKGFTSALALMAFLTMKLKQEMLVNDNGAWRSWEEMIEVNRGSVQFNRRDMFLPADVSRGCCEPCAFSGSS